MRYLSILLILFMVFACKRKNPEPTAPPVEEQQKLFGIEGLSVKGVDKAGIIFSHQDGNPDNISEPGRIQITLPPDYEDGEEVTLYFTMKEGYGIGTGYDTRLESDTLTLHYEGGHFTFLVLTPENKARNQIYIYINPTKP